MSERAAIDGGHRGAAPITPSPCGCCIDISLTSSPDTRAPHAVATNQWKKPTRNDMADNDLEILTNARAVLIEVRRNFAKAIAAGYKRGETEIAIKSVIEVQHALDVIDHAAEELEEAEDEGDDEEED
jgi:hypothetical protein